MLLACTGVLLAQTTTPPDNQQQPGQSAFGTAHKPVCPGPAGAEMARCHSHVVTDSKGNPNATPEPRPTAMTPQQFQTAYGLNGLVNTAGLGQTIAIVDAYDDPTAESDLGVYSSKFGLPPCTTDNGCFTKVDQNGRQNYPSADADWALEISLDVQTAHAICPNCKILLVEAVSNSFSNLIAAEDYATANANVVSNSWGGGEWHFETKYDSHFNKPGVPITVSSGDSGYGVAYPAASPYVTAVGGTTLNLRNRESGDYTRASETVWSGSGSGCSAVEPKLGWQHDAGCSKRTVADVAADADPATGAAVYDSTPYNGETGWWQVGGTSLSSPLIAAVYALAGNGNVTSYGSYPYIHITDDPTSLYDVTSGSNGSCPSKKKNTSTAYLCTGGTGYDGPTGLGTPNGIGAF
jgi:subtilase family serine protease